MTFKHRQLLGKSKVKLSANTERSIKLFDKKHKLYRQAPKGEQKSTILAELETLDQAIYEAILEEIEEQLDHFEKVLEAGQKAHDSNEEILERLWSKHGEQKVFLKAELVKAGVPHLQKEDNMKRDELLSNR
mgnify:CR=1 FL=1